MKGEMMTSVEVGMMTPPTPVAVKPLPVKSSLRLPMLFWMNSARVSSACFSTLVAAVARSSWYFWTVAMGPCSVLEVFFELDAVFFFEFFELVFLSFCPFLLENFYKN